MRPSDPLVLALPIENTMAPHSAPIGTNMFRLGRFNLLPIRCSRPDGDRCLGPSLMVPRTCFTRSENSYLLLVPSAPFVQVMGSCD